jgi:REP element-mobilizing transposase RayT
MAKPVGPGRKALRKGRFSQPNGIYLVTTITEQRIPWFQVFDFARIACRCLQDETCLLDATSLCWVVMPDHVHLLLQLGETELAAVVRRLKASSALKLNREIGRKGRLWSPSFHDHALRREEDLRKVARYIVANPLRAGLVAKVGDYPYWNAVWL